MTFEIDPQPWISSDVGTPELQCTSALLRIGLDGRVATSVHDSRSCSTTDRVRVSVYPLALWLAHAWWRLRWEPTRIGDSPLDWRMSHESAACGYGYLWPRLRFASDGERVEVVCEPSPAVQAEPIRFLESFRAVLTAGEFERSVDRFVDLVLARLENQGIGASELAEIWRSVRNERDDEAVSEYRRLEAMLGYDPDAAPTSLLERLLGLKNEVGRIGIEELAPVCAGPNPDATLTKLLDDVRTAATVEGRFNLPRLGPPSAGLPPWDRGRKLARDLRQSAGLDGRPVANTCLADLLGVQETSLSQGASSRLPLGVALHRENAKTRYAFRRRRETSRRFEAARWVAEALSTGTNQSCWLTSTDQKTAHQKFQRAFSAELLAPIDALKDKLRGDYSEESVADAADHFSVSPLAVLSHLANNGLISPETVPADLRDA